MANYTPNYNLKKPIDSEYYDVADQNGNMDKIDTALSTLNSNIANLITTDSFTTDSATIAAGDRGVFTKSVTKTGYTALGIIQIALANNWLEIGSFTISGNTAQIVLHNKGGNAQTTTITFTVLYKKT